MILGLIAGNSAQPAKYIGLIGHHIVVLVEIVLRCLIITVHL